MSYQPRVTSNSESMAAERRSCDFKYENSKHNLEMDILIIKHYSRMNDRYVVDDNSTLV